MIVKMIRLLEMNEAKDLARQAFQNLNDKKEKWKKKRGITNYNNSYTSHKAA
jgi:hypothetical protein